MELKLGKMTNKDLAEWFGISPNSLSKNITAKLEELKYFANYHLEGNKTKKVVIDEILEPVYQKRGSETYNKVKNNIDNVWDESGYDTCSRVGGAIYEKLKGEDEHFNYALSTVVNYTRKGRNELYGVPFGEEGVLGSCVYQWCKKDEETGKIRALTDEENEIKEQLQKKYFGNASEKQIIVQAMVESGELPKEQAWEMLTALTNMKGNNFIMFLQELQAVLGHQVVRGTHIERKMLK